MKLVKSLLLGSATGLMAVAGAQAADLPVRKAAPVEYVRICDAYGAGFFYIPGTDTCLRIGGFVRAEYAILNSQNVAVGAGTINAAGVPTRAVATTSSRAQDTTGFRARGRLQFDARTQTAWGTLRAFGRFDWTQDTGVYIGGGATSYFSVRYVFIQWAGITAGSAQSFFDFYADAYNFEAIKGSGTQTSVLAYTATFGGGFSATIALEDRNRRRPNGATLGGLAGVTYAGYTWPDLVANLRVDQGWGSAQISGAVHALNTQQGTAIGSLGKDNDWGWAVQGGVKINLPMLAAGDNLYLQAAYSKGANDYNGYGANSSGFSRSSGFLARQHGGLIYADSDAFCYNQVAGGYSCEKTEIWSVTAALQHYWAPNFNQTIYGTYSNVKPGAVTRSLDWTAGGVGKGERFTVGTTFTWSPVAGFDIGLDLIYSRINQQLAGGTNIVTGAAQAITALPVGVKKNTDAYEARLRLQRAF